jgi:uncharacterized protein YdaU (DUF1376 family)
VNYYEHHLGDYDEATAHLSAVEDGIYSRLLRKYYATERPLPTDIPTLQRWVRARSKEEKKSVTDVLSEFFFLDDDGWHQARCDRDIAHFQSKSSKAKASANVRWERERREALANSEDANAYANASDAADANAYGAHSEGNAPRARPQSPVTSPQSLIPNPPNGGYTVSDETGDLLGDAIPAGIPDCPQRKILELWATLMPELQQPAKWTDARSTILRARWKDEAAEHGWRTADDGLRVFAKLFRWCRQSKFLMGHGNGRTPGQAPFSLTLPWLLKSENWAKVQEGNYHSES